MTRNKLNERWFICYECFYESSRRMTFGPFGRRSNFIWEISVAPLIISLVWQIHPRFSIVHLFAIPKMLFIFLIASDIGQSAFKHRSPTRPSNVTITSRSLSVAFFCLATNKMYNSAVVRSLWSSYLRISTTCRLQETILLCSTLIWKDSWVRFLIFVMITTIYWESRQKNWKYDIVARFLVWFWLKASVRTSSTIIWYTVIIVTVSQM